MELKQLIKEKQDTLKQLVKEKGLNKIYPNRDECGYILTYSIITKFSDGTLMLLERNTRKELKCFEELK